MITTNKDYICHSYIPGGNLREEAVAKINFRQITHTNIAFALVERDENGFFVPDIAENIFAGIRLVQAEIERQGAASKLLISIGGWGAGNFCEAAATDQSRTAFAEKCLDYLKSTGIQGIDIDWEYPGRCEDVISACKNCKTDYIKLCKTIRDVIGGAYLLTAAVGSHLSRDLDWAQLNDVFDYVNVMTYDMSKSAHSSFVKTTMSMRLWSGSGFDKSKLVLGIPFYARCKNEKYNAKGYAELMALVRAGKATLQSSKNQDYVVIDGNRCGIDTPASIARKGIWVKKNGYAGMFNWQEMTDDNGELRAAMRDSLD